MLKLIILRYVFALLVIVALGASQGISIRRNRLTLFNQSDLTCSANMACRLAVCQWERIPRISDDRCSFLHTHCTCPEDKICAMPSSFVSRDKLVIFQYRCRNPAEVLFRDTPAED